MGKAREDGYELKPVLDGVAFYLNGGWMVNAEPSSWGGEDNHYLVNPVQGWRLAVKVGGYQVGESRLVIRGEHPDYLAVQATHVPLPSITVNRDRQPAQIAADIERRMMPDYKVGMAQIDNDFARAKREFDLGREMVDALIAVFDETGTVPTIWEAPDNAAQKWYSATVNFGSYDSWMPYGKVYDFSLTYGSPTVDLELRYLSIEDAVLVLETLLAHRMKTRDAREKAGK